jgi:hypothetical protein
MTTQHAAPYPASYPPSSPPPPPPSRGPLVAVLVTALVAGLVGLLLGVTGTLAVQSRAADEAPDDEDAARPAADVVPERLPELVAWIEERTGETFTTQPAVTVLPDREFEEALLAPVEGGEGEPASLPTDDWTSTVAALGLVADPDAYDRWTETGFAGDVVGFYDQQAEAIRLRDTSWGPSMEVTLVHELVHALQDQVVDLDAVQARTRLHDESYTAFHAVVEGHATVVEEDWLAEQDAAYVDGYWSDVPGGGGVSEPFGEAMAALPYDLGWWGVVVLEDVLGPDATFEALRDPPTTLEQLWDTQAWVSGSTTAADPLTLPDVQAPDGAEVLDRGSLGVHLLSLLTLEPEEYAELPAEDELPLSGWAGDAYVTWEDGSGACTQVQVKADSDAAAGTLAEGLEEFRADGGTLRVQGNVVLLERCTG